MTAILTTQRLVLRPPHERDFDAVRAMLTDPQMQRYERDDLSEARAREYFERILADGINPAQTHRRWVITLPGDDTARGVLHCSVQNADIREYEIGWFVARADWGKGYATEAARAVIRFAFERLDAHRVVAFCHAQNAASERVMQKLGMQREGLLRQARWLNSQWYDELAYAILESDPLSP